MWCNTLIAGGWATQRPGWGPASVCGRAPTRDEACARAGGREHCLPGLGSGAVDLVLLSTFLNQIEHHWELPSFARALERLASFARVIMLDK